MINYNVMALNIFTKAGDWIEDTWDSIVGSIEKALNSLVDQIIEALLDWIFTLIYGLLAGILKVVEFISEFFDVFAGTSKVIYKNESDFLLNIFFSHEGINNVFWAMALIAIVLAFGFAIFSISRSITDVSGTSKQAVGQIMSQFFRCMITLLLLNVMVVASVNISNVLLDRINFAMLNADNLDEDPDGRTFSEQEYATMTKIMATIGNYCVNESADNRYNLNSCFNAIRGDLQALQASGVFDYTYEKASNGHHTWQSALQQLVNAADLTRDLSLDVYNTNVSTAILTIADELESNSSFRPVESVEVSVMKNGSVQTDDLIFLIIGMGSANNSAYNNGNLNDALRAPYVSGAKSYLDISQVKKDFNIRTMDYFVGFVASIVFIIIMAICIFTFIVRMFNILLLYITAPLFVSSMPLDEGAKFQNWLQAFVVQLFSGFGQVIAMRLYLIIIPAAMGDDLVFFPGDGLWINTLNWFARLLMLLGGAWAVLKAGSLISGILAGNPTQHAAQQEGAIGEKSFKPARKLRDKAVGKVEEKTKAAYKGVKSDVKSGVRAGVSGVKSGIKRALNDTADIVDTAKGGFNRGVNQIERILADRNFENKAGDKSESGKQMDSSSGWSDSSSDKATEGKTYPSSKSLGMKPPDKPLPPTPDKSKQGDITPSSKSLGMKPPDKPLPPTPEQSEAPSSQSLGKTPPRRKPPLNPKQVEEAKQQ